MNFRLGKKLSSLSYILKTRSPLRLCWTVSLSSTFCLLVRACGVQPGHQCCWNDGDCSLGPKCIHMTKINRHWLWCQEAPDWWGLSLSPCVLLNSLWPILPALGVTLLSPHPDLSTCVLVLPFSSSGFSKGMISSLGNNLSLSHLPCSCL